MLTSDRGRFQILIILSDDDKNNHLPSVHLDLIDDLYHDEAWDQCLDKCAGQKWDAVLSNSIVCIGHAYFWLLLLFSS